MFDDGGRLAAQRPKVGGVIGRHRRLAAGGRDALQGGRASPQAVQRQPSRSRTARRTSRQRENCSRSCCRLMPAPNAPDGAGSGLGARLQLRPKCEAATASSRARTRRPPCAARAQLFVPGYVRLPLSPQLSCARSRETNRSRDAPAEYRPSESSSRLRSPSLPTLAAPHQTGHVEPASAACLFQARISCSGRPRLQAGRPQRSTAHRTTSAGGTVRPGVVSNSPSSARSR